MKQTALCLECVTVMWINKADAHRLDAHGSHLICSFLTDGYMFLGIRQSIYNS